jgi:hypothetical protein
VTEALKQLDLNAQEAAKRLLEELHEHQRERVKKFILDCCEEKRLLDDAGPKEEYMRKQRYNLFRARLVYFDAFNLRIPRRRDSLRTPEGSGSDGDGSISSFNAVEDSDTEQAVIE